MKSIVACLLGMGITLMAADPAPGSGPTVKVPPLIAKIPEKSDFFGEWMRGDGDYRLKIAKTRSANGVTVTYFNPKPINVESAQFSEQEHTVILTIVLRDEGYPGSTYRLTFDSSYRILAGAYLMPQSGQQHQVYFEPAKAK